MNILEYENYQEKISHGNPLFPYITYLCSIPLDFSYVPIHWHDEMELIYIKKGHGIITVDFTQYQVSAGTLALIIRGSYTRSNNTKIKAWNMKTLFFIRRFFYPSRPTPAAPTIFPH